MPPYLFNKNTKSKSSIYDTSKALNTMVSLLCIKDIIFHFNSNVMYNLLGTLVNTHNM